MVENKYYLDGRKASLCHAHKLDLITMTTFAHNKEHRTCIFLVYANFKHILILTHKSTTL